MVLQERSVVTTTDRSRLERMTRSLRDLGEPLRSFVGPLEDRVRRAVVVPAADVPDDVITMNSRVFARDLDSGSSMAFTLVYHGDSDMFDGKLSVLTSLGLQFLGARGGDVVEWRVPGGVRRLRVERVLYQPEAAGDFDR